jgi:galactokinase
VTAAPDAREVFSRHFGYVPAVVVRSPGRVNLIGDHTDYNDGFVLPLAIERAVWVAARPRDDGAVRVWSEHAGEWTEFPLDRRERTRGWEAYLQGVAHQLVDAGNVLDGWEGVIVSDIPPGAGLSSSAALELATAMTFSALSGFAWDPVAMALLCQRAESEWVGVDCGIMDQLTCATGLAGSALLIDCRHLTRVPVALPSGVAVVILDTGTRRSLAGSSYNERRATCEAAARSLGVPKLRDLTADALEHAAATLDPVTLRRARHVVGENARVLEMAHRLAGGDVEGCGDLMVESHASLRDDFEVSSDALDAMVEAARGAPGCHGARMTGAGFGGSCVALVDSAAMDRFPGAVEAAYRRSTGHDARIVRTGGVAGTSTEPEGA